MVRIQDVRNFWEANPVAAAGIPYPRGSRQYFEYYDKLREANESLEFSYALHEYKQFRGKKVLDVGSGNGYVLSKYALEGAQVFGIDITEEGIGLCRQRFELLDLSGNFYHANAEDLPFANETFDCVCSMGVLHHVPDTVKAVGEIYRVLKRGGRLILMMYHRDSVEYRLRFPVLRLLTGKSLQQIINEVDGKGNPKGEVYSHAELRSLLGSFDQIETFSGCFLPLKGLPPASLRPILAKHWGWLLYAKGIKR